MEQKYRLGIEIIDIQHEKIFELIESLCDKCSSSELMIMIMELKDYSTYHFETEEKYFENIGFNLVEEHKNLHNQFINTIEYYYDNPKKLKREKIYIFLLSWIDKHILIEDKKYTQDKYLTKIKEL